MMQLPQIADPTLAEKAFVHRSALNENPEYAESNERLEFLGDAVLELVISHFLFSTYPEKPEGELTALRAALVKTETLAQTAKELEFGERMILSKGEKRLSGQTNPSLLANTFEAFLGALYLDQGYGAVETFLHGVLIPKIQIIQEMKLEKDYKSKLQEYFQQHGKEPPTYEVIAEDGPDHDKTFTVAVMSEGQQLADSRGKTKHAAQQQAAKLALEKLTTS